MDKIRLNRIELMGSIGVLDEEKSNVQPYWISVEIGADLKPAASDDRLDLTIDYSDVFNTCKTLMNELECELIETFAERLIERIFEEYRIADVVSVEVLKPDAPIAGATFESVGVEITRKRCG